MKGSSSQSGGGIAAVLAFGLGLLIVDFSLPADQPEQRGSIHIVRREFAPNHVRTAHNFICGPNLLSLSIGHFGFKHFQKLDEIDN